MRHNYTHPHPDPRHIMVHYRKFIIGQKRVYMAQGKGNRAIRGHLKYKQYIQEYLAAKELVITSERQATPTT